MFPHPSIPLTLLRSITGFLLLATLAALPARADLPDALNPDLIWTTNPTFPWVEVLDITHDDISAAQSSPLQVGQQSWLRTSVNGPGLLQFWWKVSSDLDFGFLRFRIGTNYLDISGEVEWDFVSIPIPPGSNTVEWIYDKRAGASSSGDAAWLDEVAFVPGPTPPFVLQSPESADLLAGSALILRAVVLGSDPLHYQWQLNNTNLAGANGPTYSIAVAGTNQYGLYRLIATNAYGAVTSSVATVTVSLDPLAVAVNSPLLLWETTPFGPWAAQTNVTHDGKSAAKSGEILDNESTAISTRVIGPGEISFWWKVSADFGDILDFTINGVEQDFITEEMDWEKHSYAIPPGEVVLEWAYIKDNLPATSGDDAGYLDEVTFVPAPRLAGPAYINSNNVFTVSVPTQSGKNYTLEYRDNLGGTNWTALPTVPGTGANKVLTDTNAPTSRRFYRLRQF